MSVCLVLTTIAVPTVLESYRRNATRFGHRRISCVVIGDRKTPPEAEEYCRKVSGPDFEVTFLDCERQERELGKFPRLLELLPYDSYERKNLGYLWAYLAGHSVFVDIDDDNYATDEDDFFGALATVGSEVTLRAVSSATGFVNVCALLRAERRFYPRGFPVDRRWQDERWTIGVRRGRHVVAAGLWLETPDVDATAHLEGGVRTTGFDDRLGQQVTLAPGMLCPINSQATAIHRDLLPAMFLPLMGGRLYGQVIGRYQDIWRGYFLQALVDALDGVVSWGQPLVVQHRNPHDYLVDLRAELPGMLLTPRLLDTMRAVQLRGPACLDAYDGLVRGLRAGLQDAPRYSADERQLIAGLVDGMEIWSEVCSQVYRA